MPLLRFRGLASFHRSCLLRRFSNLARCFERTYASLVRRFHQRFPPSTFPIHRPNRSPKSFLRIYIPETYIHIYIYIKLRRQRKTYFTPHTSSISSFHLSIIHQGRRSQGRSCSPGSPSSFFPRKKLSLRACTHTHAHTHTRWRGGHKSSSVRRIINSWTRIGVSSRMPRETRRPPPG